MSTDTTIKIIERDGGVVAEAIVHDGDGEPLQICSQHYVPVSEKTKQQACLDVQEALEARALMPGDPTITPMGDPIPPMKLDGTPTIKVPVMDAEDETSALARQNAALHNRLAEMEHELARWKRMVGWLASCHATTLHTLPASASKQLRIRVTNICKNFILYFAGAWQPKPPEGTMTPEQEVEQEVAWCHRVVEEDGMHE